MKYLFLIGLCLYSSLSYSQVFRLRAFSVHIALLNENGDEISDKDIWAESTAFVVINMDKLKVQVYGKRDADIDLISRDTPREVQEKISFDFKGIDKDGNKCDVTVAVYKGTPERHVATLVINYPDMKMAVIYRLKRDS